LAAGLCFFFLPPILDVVHQLVVAAVAANAIVLGAAELNGPESSKVLCILGDLDQLLRFSTIRDLDLALLPHARNIRLPRLSHAANKAVGAAQQEHMRAQGIAAREHA